ncbi:GFA family protein, partial [Mesorhizobium sp. M1E.F.Ca.ET.063.01.1.1]
MPVLLKGSCRCGAVRFEVESHTPVPFMLCYCSICRKQQGGGGFAINLGADYDTMKIRGKRGLGVYRAEIEDDEHPR